MTISVSRERDITISGLLDEGGVMPASRQASNMCISAIMGALSSLADRA